jgi:hypothetical protein
MTKNVVIEWLTLLLRVQEVPGSNIGPETGCPEFFLSFLSLPGKCRDSALY